MVTCRLKKINNCVDQRNICENYKDYSRGEATVRALMKAA